MYASTLPPTFLTTFRRYLLYVLLIIPVRTVYLVLMVYLAQFLITQTIFTQLVSFIGSQGVIVCIVLVLLMALIPPVYFITVDNRWLQAGLSRQNNSWLLIVFSVVSIVLLWWGYLQATISATVLGVAGILAILHPCFVLFKNVRRWRLPFRFYFVGGVIALLAVLLLIPTLNSDPLFSIKKDLRLLPINTDITAPGSVSPSSNILKQPNNFSEIVFRRLLGFWTLFALLWSIQWIPVWRDTRTRLYYRQRLQKLITLTPTLTILSRIRDGCARLQARYSWLPLFLLFLSPFPLTIAVILTLDLEAGAELSDKLAILAFGFGLTLLLLLTVADAMGRIVQQLRETRRYLMLPFVVVGRANQEVQSIANLLTYTLITELQRVGTLLQWHQTEYGGGVTSPDSYAMFVAAGLEHDFVEELRNLKSLEVDNGTVRFPLGRILERFIESTSKVRLQGTVQQRENGAIEIWIQMTRRDSPTVSAEHVMVSSNSTADINEITADAIARELACKLVLQLTEGQPLAANPASLQHFLAGIEAIVQRKWWLAIAHYRNALGMEQTAQAKYGLMHYHLGAAFIVQGDVTKGSEQLELAEQSGLVLPELQYMLARTLLYKYWTHLDQKDSVFDEIVRRSLTALRLRPNTPEVLHLLGALYYQRGRLVERKQFRLRPRQGFRARTTDTHPESRGTPRLTVNWSAPITRKSRDYYRQAEMWFRRAEVAYDQVLRNLASPVRHTQGVAGRELNHLLQTRIAVTHQRADALRGQRKFIRADLAYRDVVELFPENLRNLVDIAKTYCLAGNWQYGHSFIQERVLRNIFAQWNADANFYAGWTLAGGVADRGRWDKPNNGVYRLLFCQVPESREVLLVQAMRYMDFALIQRPRYLARWQQNDWFTPYLEAVKQSNLVAPEYRDAKNGYEATLLSPLTSDASLASPKLLLSQSVLWLILRFCQYQFHIDTPTGGKPIVGKDGQEEGFVNTDFINEARQLMEASNLGGKKKNGFVSSLKSKIRLFLQVPKWIFKKKSSPAVVKQSVKLTANSVEAALPSEVRDALNHVKLLGIFSGLVALRNQLVSDLIYNRETIPLERTWTRLNLAVPATELWGNIRTTVINKLDDPNEPLTLAGRVKVELVAETALLTTRLLVEGGAYLEAARVVTEAVTYLSTWREQWQQKFPGNRFLFSSQVFRYQLASLYAWQAYINLQHHQNKVHQFRMRLTLVRQKIASPPSESLVLVEMQKSLQAAFELMRTHPLAMFVQAQLRLRQNLYVQAAEELQFLLQTLSPFDPSRFIRRWGPGESRHTTPPPSPEARLLVVLEKMGYVNGSHQFASIVNESTIHALLAEIYDAQNLNDLAVDQSRAALRWQRPSLYVVQHYVALSRRLMNQERFREAEAVLATIRVPGRQSAIPLEVVSHHIELEVLRCVLATRKGDHEQSLAMGETIAQTLETWDIGTFVEQLTNHWGDEHENLKALKQEYFVIQDRLGQLKSNQFIKFLFQLGKPQVPQAQAQSDLMTSLITAMPDVFTHDANGIGSSDSLFASLKPAAYGQLDTEQLQRMLELNYAFMVIMAKNEDPDTTMTFLNLRRQLLDWLQEGQLRTSRRRIRRGRIFRAISKEPPESPSINFIIRTQILYRFFEYQLNYLLQIAELSNTLAYNHSELDIRHRYAFQHARYAILIARYIESLGMGVFDEASLRDLRGNLAQYHDTLGWIYYRAHTSFVGKHRRYLSPLVRHLQRTLTGLEVETDGQRDDNDLFIFPLLFLARDHLERALSYDPDRAIFYYHLARTHTTNLEYKWQGIPNKRDLSEIAKAAPIVMMHLRKADRYWTRAKRLDTSNRLHTRLVWLRQRIQEYRDAWNTRQVTQFSGKFEEDEQDYLPSQDLSLQAKPNKKSPR